MAVAATACGADDTGEGPTSTVDGGGPRVADPRFEGTFVVSELTVDGEVLAIDLLPTVAIDTVFGRLTVEPGCNTFFGSYTLAEDGEASFTIAGGTGRDCPDLADQEEAVVAALRNVTSWTETDDGFRFDGADRSLTIVPG
jgi:heat shock protein HslJ